MFQNGKPNTVEHTRIDLTGEKLTHQLNLVPSIECLKNSFKELCI